jgi:hypothetical protein
VAGALLAPPASGRAAAGADAAAWDPPLIRAQAVATPESRPDVTLSAMVLEEAFDGIEGGVYRRLALADRREAALPAGADVREPEGPMGARVPARMARIFRDGPGTSRPAEGLATALEAAWPGDGVSWKTAAAGQEDENLVGIKIKNLQLGMTEQQFFSKVQEYFPIIIDSAIFETKINKRFVIPNKKLYFLVTKSYTDKFKNIEQMSEKTYMSYKNSLAKLSTVLFKDGKLVNLMLTEYSFMDLFNIKNAPSLYFIHEFSNAYGLQLTPKINNGSVYYEQHTKLWHISVLAQQSKIKSIHLILIDYDNTSLGPPTFD